MGQVVNLPHHRRAPIVRGPRVDERRREPGDRATFEDVLRVVEKHFAPEVAA